MRNRNQHQIAFLFSLLLVLLCPARAQSPTDAEIEKLARWMTGVFDTFAQVARDEAANAPYKHVKAILKITPLNIAGMNDQGARTLYIEQALAEAEDKPYRQGIYYLHRVNGVIINRNFKLIDNATEFIGAHRNPAVLNKITKERLTPVNGCDITLTKINEERFSAIVGLHRTCKSTLRGATHMISQGEITPHYQVTLDQGFDDTGAHKWGPPPGTMGHLFMKRPATTNDSATIGGIFEICIGVRAADAQAQIRYWEQLGYRVGSEGRLTAAAAKQLYGVESNLRAIRLLQQDSEHGLIRLLVWDKPVNEGLGLVRLIAPGSRWTSTLTRDVLNLYNHAEAAARAKLPIHVVPPQWSEIYKLAQSAPFTGDIVGVRELIVLQPYTRQMFFERFGYTAPTYGKINEDAKFKTSQVTHSGLVFASDDANAVKFYSEVLGLKLAVVEKKTTYEDLDPSSRNLYDLKPGEFYYGTAVDDPRSGDTPDKAISGRMLVRRIPLAQAKENLIARAQPGSLGLSLYVYRVRGLAAYHAKVKASAAHRVSAIRRNEFGEASFSFTAPDGHVFNLLEQ
jgi:catechol 2,3-dioxygenase-like lactoylglutathione lyase family enzyme